MTFSHALENGIEMVICAVVCVGRICPCMADKGLFSKTIRLSINLRITFIICSPGFLILFVCT